VSPLAGAWRTRRDGTLVVLPSLDLFEADASQEFSDVDLVYFADREVVLGEVKADPCGFSRADLNRRAS